MPAFFLPKSLQELIKSQFKLLEKNLNFVHNAILSRSFLYLTFLNLYQYINLESKIIHCYHKTGIQTVSKTRKFDIFNKFLKTFALEIKGLQYLFRQKDLMENEIQNNKITSRSWEEISHRNSLTHSVSVTFSLFWPQYDIFEKEI